jgi:hypothetical protein
MWHPDVCTSGCGYLPEDGCDRDFSLRRKQTRRNVRDPDLIPDLSHVSRWPPPSHGQNYVKMGSYFEGRSRGRRAGSAPHNTIDNLVSYARSIDNSQLNFMTIPRLQIWEILFTA